MVLTIFFLQWDYFEMGYFNKECSQYPLDLGKQYNLWLSDGEN